MPSPRSKRINSAEKIRIEENGGQAFSVISKWFKGEQTNEQGDRSGEAQPRQFRPLAFSEGHAPPLASMNSNRSNRSGPAESCISNQSGQMDMHATLSEVMRAVQWSAQLLLEERDLAKERVADLHRMVEQSMDTYCQQMRHQSMVRGNEQSEMLQKHREDFEHMLGESAGQTQKMMQQELRGIRISSSQNFQRLFDVIETVKRPTAPSTGSFLSGMQHDMSVSPPATPHVQQTVAQTVAPSTLVPAPPVMVPAPPVHQCIDVGDDPIHKILAMHEVIRAPSHDLGARSTADTTSTTNTHHAHVKGMPTKSRRESGASLVGTLFGLDRDSESERLVQQLQRMHVLESRFSGKDMWLKVLRCLGLPKPVVTNDLIDPRQFDRCVRFVDGTMFSIISIAVIILNAWWMGFVTDEEMRARMRIPPEDPPDHYREVSRVFSAYFCLELLIRIVALRRLFYTRSDRAWNVFDSFIVLSAILEEVLEFASLGFLRILRLLRLIRVIRILRVLRFFSGLQMMIVTVISSFQILVWAVVVILFVIYLFAVLLLQSSYSFLSKDDVEGWTVLSKHYSSVDKTMYSLLAAISGGLPWMDLADELSRVSWVLRPLFAGYIVLIVFGFLNVVTGVFVNKANDIVQQDGNIAIQRELDQTNAFVRDLASYISEYENVPSSYVIDEEQFISLLGNNLEVQMLLQTHSIDITAARELFNILSKHGHAEGAVTIENFVFGCQRMKGPAKAMDVILLFEEVVNIRNTMHENRDRQQAVTREMKAWQERCVGMFAKMCSSLDIQLDKVVHGTQFSTA